MLDALDPSGELYASVCGMLNANQKKAGLSESRQDSERGRQLAEYTQEIFPFLNRVWGVIIFVDIHQCKDNFVEGTSQRKV